MDNLALYHQLVPPDQAIKLTQAIERPLVPAIRVNTLKADPQQAIPQWAAWYGWLVEPIAFCPTGWRVVEHQQAISRTVEHKMGCYYVQDAASMLPVELFDFDEPARLLVLDMAASPGGKTTHLVSKLNDRGLVIANDSSASRLGALYTNVQDWGALSIALTNYPAERFGGWFPEVFDKVLLDAPCSGESLRTAERRKTRSVSARERLVLHQRQVNLLTSAFQALRPGGQIVYATCTLAPQEDEAVLDALLRLYPQAGIQAVDRHLPVPAPGLASDGEHTFHADVTRAVRLWPHLYDTSGFFAALIRKHDSVAPQPMAPPARPFAKAGFEALKRAERERLRDEMARAYGCDLDALLARHECGLWRRQRAVYALPERYLAQFAELPFTGLGMALGEYHGDDFVPSHEFAARFQREWTAGRLALDEEQAGLWLAGRDLRGVQTRYPPGTVIFLEDSMGRFLGRGRALADRVRNLLPRRLIY